MLSAVKTFLYTFAVLYSMHSGVSLQSAMQSCIFVVSYICISYIVQWSLFLHLVMQDCTLAFSYIILYLAFIHAGMYLCPELWKTIFAFSYVGLYLCFSYQELYISFHIHMQDCSCAFSYIGLYLCCQLCITVTYTNCIFVELYICFHLSTTRLYLRFKLIMTSSFLLDTQN